MSIDHLEKHTKAMDELQQSGIWKRSYLPPYYKLSMKLGIKGRPPHYNSFLTNVVQLSVFVGLFCALVMYFLFKSKGVAMLDIFSTSATIGTLIGLVMGAYYFFSSRSHSLTPWDDL